MWRRLRRKSFGPRRPLVWREQLPLAVISVAVLVGSAAYAVYVVFVR